MNCRVWPVDARLRHWHPVVIASTVTTKPSGLQCCGVPIVLFRTGSGITAAYDRCPHRRMPLSHGSVGPDGITCPYHGCRFAPDGSGWCPTTGSNRFRVPVFETKLMCGVIWVRWSAESGLQEHSHPGAGLNPDLSDDDHAFAAVIHKNIAAPVQLVLDNMTELEHTGMVHRQLAFGIDDFATVETRCEHDAESVSILYRGLQRPLPLHLSTFMGVRGGDWYTQSARVSFMPPCASYRIWWTTRNGQQERPFGLRFVNYYTEIDRNQTSLFCFVYWKTAGASLHAFARAAAPLFRSVVSAELERDRQIIEKMPQGEATLDWFQLNHFDRPLVATRKLMQTHYMPASHTSASGEPCVPPPNGKEEISCC